MLETYEILLALMMGLLAVMIFVRGRASGRLRFRLSYIVIWLAIIVLLAIGYRWFSEIL